MSQPVAPAAPPVAAPRKIILTVAGLAALLAVLLVAFGMPAAHTGAHGVQLGVVGTPAQTDQLTKRLDGFEITTYPTDAAAATAIRHREVYGALDLGTAGPAGPAGAVKVLVATGASYQAATMIEQVGQTIATADGSHATTTDLRPFPSDDPKGAGLAAGALPIALGGWIGAVAIMLLIPTPGRRAITALSFAVVGGLALTAIIQYVIGTFDGDYLLTALGAMLGIAATAMAVLGLRGLLGGLGLGIAAIALIVLGNPLSGLASAPEMLPRPWGAIGQYLPPGAIGTLLRDLALFDGHGSLHSFLVLAGWLVGGCVLFWLGVRRDRGPAGVGRTEIEIEEALGEYPVEA